MTKDQQRSDGNQDTTSEKTNRMDSRWCNCDMTTSDRRTHTKPLRYAPQQPTMTNLDSQGTPLTDRALSI